MVRRDPTAKLWVELVELWGCVCAYCNLAWRVNATDVHGAQGAGELTTNIAELGSTERWPACGVDSLKATHTTPDQAQALATAHVAMLDAQRR